MSETPLDPDSTDHEAPEADPEERNEPKRGVNDPNPDGVGTDEPLTPL